jgi:shikimate kinase
VLKLSFIGMSGAGKTYWAQKLAAAGFRIIGIDDRIEEQLAPQLAAGGFRGIGGVAAWMGWPDQPSYREREKKYLGCEVRAMTEALDEIQASEDQGIILDTTGSVVYTGEEICRRMQSLTTVVYLEASPPEEKLLIARYLSDPKPVLWGDQFVQRPGESSADAVARCYPRLIGQRKNLYERCAHRVLSIDSLTDTHQDARGLLESIEGQARPAR